MSYCRRWRMDNEEDNLGGKPCLKDCVLYEPSQDPPYQPRRAGSGVATISQDRRLAFGSPSQAASASKVTHFQFAPWHGLRIDAPRHRRNSMTAPASRSRARLAGETQVTLPCMQAATKKATLRLTCGPISARNGLSFSPKSARISSGMMTRS
jgi:hypothetical protein